MTTFFFWALIGVVCGFVALLATIYLAVAVVLFLVMRNIAPKEQDYFNMGLFCILWIYSVPRIIFENPHQ